MRDVTYEQRRGEIEHYFDRTAVAAWEKLTRYLAVVVGS
jgi:hypothetical protein